MSAKPTEDELDEILHDIAEEAASYWDGGMSRSMTDEDLEREFAKARAAIRIYTTNKIIEELERLMATHDDVFISDDEGTEGLPYSVIKDRITELKSPNHRKDKKL